MQAAVPEMVDRLEVVATGDRFARWFVGLCVAATGLFALVLSEEVGAFDPAWSWALVGGGLLYVVLAEVAGRRAAT